MAVKVQIKRATRSATFARIALCGLAGSGKTFGALRILHGLRALEGRQEAVGVIDSENGKSTLYADAENPDGGRFEFDVVDLAAMPGQFSVENYIACIEAFKEAGVRYLLIDSLSHAWAGPGGVLDFKDEVTAKAKAKNAFTDGWRQATPEHNRLVQAVLSFPGHVICTMRTKTAYVTDGSTGDRKGVPVKIGTQPVQRDGLDYEFDIVCDVTQDDHDVVVGKTRCPALDNQRFRKPGKNFAKIVHDWLGAGGAIAPAEAPAPTPVAPAVPPVSDEEITQRFTDLLAKVAPGVPLVMYNAFRESKGQERIEWLSRDNQRSAYAGLLKDLTLQGELNAFAATASGLEVVQE